MSQDLLAPDTLEEVLAALADPAPPVVLAGGTDLWPQWTSGKIPRPRRVLSLHRLASLRQIRREGDHLHVGAQCTHADLWRSDRVRGASPALALAAATVGAVQIQQRGTVGGNLAEASPAADLPPPLCAAGAAVALASVRGVRHVPLPAFYLGYRQTARQPDELITAVRVPALPAGGQEHFYKVGTRKAQAISKAAGACRLVLGPDGAIASCGLAFGSVGPTVVRLAALEAWLLGQRPSAAVAQEAGLRAAEGVQPIDDLRSTAAYRRHVVGQLVQRWIAGAAG